MTIISEMKTEPRYGYIKGQCANYAKDVYEKLWLLDDEEKQANNLPADCPSQGPKGPATAHGSPAGELMHQRMN